MARVAERWWVWLGPWQGAVGFADCEWRCIEIV